MRVATVFFLFVLIFNSAALSVTQAQVKTGVFTPLVQKNCDPSDPKQPADKQCTWNDLTGAIQSIIRTLIVAVAPLVALLAVLIGAMYVMFGGPNPGNVSAGQKIIMSALFGYIIVLVSGFILDSALDVLKIKIKEPPISKKRAVDIHDFCTNNPVLTKEQEEWCKQQLQRLP